MRSVFAAMVAASFLTALLLGRMDALSAAVLASGGEAVVQLLELCGGLAVWSGVLNIARESGLCEGLGRLFRPMLRALYPGLAERAPETAGNISLSFTANLLGLGAAATPPALAAMRELDRINGCSRRASREMATLAVFNCCSVTLIPSSAAVLRQQAGSADAMEILPAVWLASAAALFAALSVNALLLGRKKR